MEFLGFPVSGIPDIVLGITASALLLVLFFYPLPVFFRIHMRWESPGTLHQYPLSFYLIACLLWFIYGCKISSPPLIENTFQIACIRIVHLAGFFVQCCHASFLQEQATSYNQISILRIHFGAALLIMLPVMTFPYLPDSLRDFVSGPKNDNPLGLVAAVYGIMMHASTIPSIVDAYKTQSSNKLPWALCTLQLLNAIAWFAYAVYTPTYNIYLATSNGAAIILGIIQLLTCHNLLVKCRKSGATVDPGADHKISLLDAIV